MQKWIWKEGGEALLRVFEGKSKSSITLQADYNFNKSVYLMLSQVSLSFLSDVASRIIPLL